MRTLLFLASVTSLSALEWKGSLDLVGGYRNDSISTEIYTEIPKGNFLYADVLKAEYVNGFEGGIKGDLLLDEVYFFRFEGDAGSYTWGGYNENLRLPHGDILLDTNAHINGSFTLDGTAAIGYFFQFPCFKLGPIFGWSYDEQKIKLEHVFTDRLRDPGLDGLTYKTWWQGPFLGVETSFFWRCLHVEAAYEFHFSDWHGRWQLPNGDVTTAFSDHRHASCAYGNVVFVNLSYRFCSWLEAGIGVDFKDFRARNGREAPLSGSFALAEEVDVVHRATWRSIGGKGWVGLKF